MLKGFSSKTISIFKEVIGDRFNSLITSFIGIVPKKKGKNIVFSTNKNSLVELFFQALDSTNPTKEDKDALKIILGISNDYLESLKNRTSARAIESINAYAINQKNRGAPISGKEIKNILSLEMDKAGKHIKLIANAETNKAINVGAAMKISKMAKRHGEEDPTVFFMVTIDDVTGSEEFRLHLLPDKKTPRVWKLSEIQSGYHKKGDNYPKLAGLHPNCRCKLAYLSEGWGFDSEGKVKFIGPDHDEFESQRKKIKKP